MSDTTYPGKVGPGDIYEIFRESTAPVLTTKEIADQVDWASRSTVHRQLQTMVAENQLRSKKAGENENAGRVWYPSEDLPDIPQPTPEPLKLLYTYPWFSLLVGGMISAGFGFLLFVPGLVGADAYLGLLDRRWLVRASIAMYGIGVAAIYVGGFVILGSYGFQILSKWQSE